MAKKMLFYERITPLNRDAHRDLRFVPAQGDCSFASNASVIPLAGAELVHGAREYPVLFSGEGDSIGLVALTGLAQGQNLFVEPSGKWREGVHVPAFVRRYPFIFATSSGSTEGQPEEFTVCIDDSYAGFSTEETEGERIFDSEGKETEFLQRTVEFLRQLQAQMQRTREFASRVEELGLLRSRDLQISDDSGGSYLVRDFRIVDEQALAALDAETLSELHGKGWLGWLYAHLISLGNFDRLRRLGSGRNE